VSDFLRRIFSIDSIFDIFSLLYIFRSLQLIVTVWRERGSIQQPPLTKRKKSLAEQASFFIAVPIGVFFHELAHATAVWSFGGQITQFAYRVFWGFVQYPLMGISTPQRWFISLAGTLGSLLFGVGIWLLLRGNKKAALRYFGLRAFRFQVYFSTIYYPIFTLLGFEGDWRTIYDFGTTPLLSGLTIPFHLGLVLLFWWGDRTGWFEQVSHESIDEQEKFRELAQAAAINSQDARLQLQYVDALRSGGAANQAKTKLKSFLEQNPDSGTAYLEMALLEIGNKPQISRRAGQYLQKALQLGLPNPAGRAYAYQLLGKYYLDGNQPTEAVQAVDDALAVQIEGEETAVARHQSALYHLRSQAHRRQKQYDLAHQDIQQAINLAQQADDEKLAAHYRQERDIIVNHAGQNLTQMPH
jgi:tetratricopeptide (TPR) repeat protein